MKSLLIDNTNFISIIIHPNICFQHCVRSSRKILNEELLELLHVCARNQYRTWTSVMIEKHWKTIPFNLQFADRAITEIHLMPVHFSNLHLTHRLEVLEVTSYPYSLAIFHTGFDVNPVEQFQA